jgi:uncharacterized protein YeaO (DUF488 family)
MFAIRRTDNRESGEDVSEEALPVIKVKHLLDAVEADDGQRIWVEPIGLTLDLRDWCKVDHVLSHLGPPRDLWTWFEAHPQGYDYFRGQYHEALSRSPYRAALVDLVAEARHVNFTLVHQGEDADHNSATALYEFLSELEAYAPPET